MSRCRDRIPYLPFLQCTCTVLKATHAEQTFSSSCTWWYKNGGTYRTFVRTPFVTMSPHQKEVSDGRKMSSLAIGAVCSPPLYRHTSVLFLSVLSQVEKPASWGEGGWGIYSKRNTDCYWYSSDLPSPTLIWIQKHQIIQQWKCPYSERTCLEKKNKKLHRRKITCH
jgi:hypothetical protein